MSANSATLAGRAAAERRMVDTCTITHAATGPGTFNETTGKYDAAAPSTVYSGKCRVKPRDNSDRVVQFGQEAISLWPYVVSIPMSETDVLLDDLVTVTASALDPALVGAVLRVRDVLAGSHLTARRMSCEVNAG